MINYLLTGLLGPYSETRSPLFYAQPLQAMAVQKDRASYFLASERSSFITIRFYCTMQRNVHNKLLGKCTWSPDVTPKIICLQASNVHGICMLFHQFFISHTDQQIHSPLESYWKDFLIILPIILGKYSKFSSLRNISLNFKI